jgi:hypothetical protein
MNKAKHEYSYQHPDGYPVYILPAKAPRKCEQVWGSNKFSAANMGAKAVSLALKGVNKRKHG